MNFQDFFNYDFWDNTLARFVEWIINQAPYVILLIILLFILLKLLNVLIRRLKRIFINRATKSPKYDTIEASKRINTLSGILKGTGKIIIWSVFLMMILKKLGIDIGPILAGAGILGLAIGFGAQELVRDLFFLKTRLGQGIMLLLMM